MSPLDDPRRQPPVTYFERMEIERRRQQRREQERQAQVRRRWRAAGIAAAVVVALAVVVGGLAWGLAGGPQNVKLVRLIITQPLTTPKPPPVMLAAAGSATGASASPKSHGPDGPHPGSSPAPAASSGGLNIQAAERAARAAKGSGTQVGFAVFNSSGEELGFYDDTMENYGASITKSMLLVAYLNQVGSGQISTGTDQVLTQMIEASDNQSADDVWGLLHNPAAQVQQVASDAGMTDFQIDTSDPVYVLGQSKITARDFALFFSKIGQMIPAAQRSYGLKLLSHLDASDQVGLLQSGLPGTVYSKEGWKGEPTITGDQPYVVNQAGQFQKDGTAYGVAVTVAQDGGSQSSNEAIVQRIGAALIR
ncbi:MAG: serine hydrolase [Solirubrobacteraceae bacterium]